MDDDEELDTAEKEAIKSTAIVKYSVPKPAQFMKLKCNTDLNLPPSNWLSSSADSYGLQHVLHHQTGFSSFRMAHMFPDCVGEVDVVSDAENIKNLLKLPYNKGHISMMVHRIENTLLLDDFDIYKHLLRTAESEWEWLREFFYEHVNRETCQEDKNLYTKNRRRDALKQKSLVSKFLYHSLVANDDGGGGGGGADDNGSNGIKSDLEVNGGSLPPLPVEEGPFLPEPADATPDSATFDHKFNRNVVWTFEDIEMLIGTDLPIFGGGTHPCISLRLRDASKPISVLTGIDYWLDNLMSNVPEVVMCYHLNGIVQKYELIKTEDLPCLDNSKFSPKLIRDVAQSILSFLKSNATKAGHTYWLFKGKNEEVVKLYDLTSLCADEDEDEATEQQQGETNGQNPFTVPVAMLLYRVARNMKHTADEHHTGTIRMLLRNCIKLLSEEKYPEIVTSSHYMLSDLYIPAGTNPESPDLLVVAATDGGGSSVYYEDDEDDLISDDDGGGGAVKVLTLDENHRCVDNNVKFVNYYKLPPPVVGNVEERCLQAIQHIADGLNCLQFFPGGSGGNGVDTDVSNKEEEIVRMAKPFEPIPMPYAKLHNDDDLKQQEKQKISKKKGLLVKKSPVKDQNNDQQLIPDRISWKDHLKTLLYEKAVLVYATLSEFNFVSGNYGAGLRTIGLLARCQQIMNKLSSYASYNSLRVNCLLGRAGDCCIMMVQQWDRIDSYRKQFETNFDEDLKMMEQLEIDERYYLIDDMMKSRQTNIMKCVFIDDLRSIEQILLKGVECYEFALKSSENDSILRRLGNSLNELASFYLNKAKLAKTTALIIEMSKKSEPYLHRGLEVFEKVKDEANIALLYTNMGHLHRLLAYANTPLERCELTAREKFHYNKAFINYKKALQVLAERNHCPGIWDAVKWELSTALFNMGCIMHDHPSSALSKSEAEKEVIETLQKALSYCDFDEENAKYPLYQYRAASIHYRIGSLYHSHIWTTTTTTTTTAANETSSNKKNVVQLAKINYEKASNLYLLAMDAVNYLKCQMQRVALFEYLSETTNVPNMKIKHLQCSLSILLEINEMIQLMVDKKVDVGDEQTPSSSSDGGEYKDCTSLLNLVRQRLQHILKSLIKLCLIKPPINKQCPKLTDMYKSCYQLSFELRDGIQYDELIKKLHNVLRLISVKVSAEMRNVLLD